MSLAAHSWTSQYIRDDPELVLCTVLSGNPLFCNWTNQPVLCYFETLLLLKSRCHCLITSLMLKCFSMVAIYALRTWCWVRKQAVKLWMAVKLWSVLSLYLKALSRGSDWRFAAGLEGNVFVSDLIWSWTWYICVS